MIRRSVVCAKHDGHVDPTTTLGIYAEMIARSDRDQLHREIRELVGIADSREGPRRARVQPEIRRQAAAKVPLKGPKRPQTR
jgi:hypothetical protein